MSKTNGSGKRAALYYRVSTDEQARSGYSIPDQQRELRAYAAREGYEITEEIEDDGYSGARPDRPGLKRITELAEAGAIDVVIATKRDRLFRSRLYRLLFDQDLKEYGVRLLALNDTGNRMADGFQDDFAEWQREVIRDNTQAGLKQKARQGKVVASSTPGHGYRYTGDRDGVEVDARAMSAVERILRSVASGSTIYGVVRDLNRDGVPRPVSNKYPHGAPSWNAATVRWIVHSDLYKPHTLQELEAEGVARDVLDRLDPDATHGLWRYQGIPVPVPGSGLPRELVEAARAAISSNRRTSYNGGRTWPLSGGVLRCPECGAAMETTTARGGGGRGKNRYPYYRCGLRYNRNPGYRATCSYNRHVPAEWVEEEVWRGVSALLDDEAELRRAFDSHAAAFRRSASDANREHLAEHLTRLERRRSGYLDLAADGHMDREELAAKLSEVDRQRSKAERELRAIQGDAAVAAEIEALRDRLVEGVRLGYWRPRRSPEERRELYLSHGLRATLDGDRVVLEGSFVPLPVSAIGDTPSPFCTTNTWTC